MMSEKTFYYASNDAMFKALFGDERNPELLVSLLQSALDLPPEDYAEISFINPILARERPEGKLGILDVRVRSASGAGVNIEIQLSSVPEIRERIIYYLSRMVTDQIGSGDDYLNIKPSICILITDFALVAENTSYHNKYRLFDPRTGSEFSGLLEVHTLELPKLPQERDGTLLWDWLKFIGARKKEELEMLAEKNPQVKKAIGKLAELNEDERERMIADSQEKLRRDIASIKRFAVKEGREEGREEGLAEGLEKGRVAVARNAIQQNLPVDLIVTLTGLSRETIQSLR